MKVVLRRSSDGAESSCDLVQINSPADDCSHNTFDDLYFDYLCPMADKVIVGGKKI